MTYVIAGVVIGVIYVIMGSSITLTYSTTGVLNLATGAIAYAIADLFYFLVAVHGVPTVWAAIICVLVVAPALGWIFWRFIFDRLENTNLVVQLVATIGLAVALPALMNLVTPHTVVFEAPGIVGGGESLVNFGAFQASRDQVAAVAGGIIVVVLLVFLIERTRAGLAMKAVVNRPVLAQTTGINTRRVSASSWMIACTFTGLAGILVAPLTQLTSSAYTSLTVAALGVALIGRFQKLIPTVIGGIALGLATSFITGYAPSSSEIYSYISPSLPFFLLVVLLLIGFRPLSSRHDAAQTTTIARRTIVRRTTAPGPAASSVTTGGAGGATTGGAGGALSKVLGDVEAFVSYRIRMSRRPTATSFRPVILGVGVILVLLAVFGAGDYWLGILGSGLTFSVIFLSFNVATGEGGILCLGQAALAAVGGFVAGRLAVSGHVPFLLAGLIGIVGACVVGMVIGLIGTRLDQLGFALITLAFILFCTEFLYPLPSVIPEAGVNFQPLSIFGIVFSSPRAQFLVNLFFFVVLAMGLLWVRRGRWGRRLAALRGNATSSQSLGINVRTVRVAVFSASAGVAGCGGILLAVTQGHLGPADVGLFTGLVWLAVAVTTGVIGVRGALVGGLMFTGIPAIFTSFSAGTVSNIVPMLFGLGAIVLAEEPRGGIANVQRQLGALWYRLRGGVAVPGRASAAPVAAPAAAQPAVAPGLASPVVAAAPTEVGRMVAGPSVAGPSVAGRAGAALEVAGVSVSFGGLNALDEVSFKVAPGEIVGLIGPNGAGKTTLLNVVSGFIQPNRGVVRLGPATISSEPVHRRAKEGLGRTYQRVSLFPELTVKQHVLLAEDLARSSVPAEAGGGGDHDEAAVLTPFGLQDWADATVDDLPLGVARLVELAMVLSLQPSVVLLDEPMSGLSATERRLLSSLLVDLRTRSGTTMLMVEHDVDTTVRMVDRLVVLDFGRVIADGPPLEVIAQAEVRSAYFGRVEAGEGVEPGGASSETVPTPSGR